MHDLLVVDARHAYVDRVQVVLDLPERTAEPVLVLVPVLRLERVPDLVDDEGQVRAVPPQPIDAWPERVQVLVRLAQGHEPSLEISGATGLILIVVVGDLLEDALRVDAHGEGGLQVERPCRSIVVAPMGRDIKGGEDFLVPPEDVHILKNPLDVPRVVSHISSVVLCTLVVGRA